ncbi:MAG: sulfatase [Pseudomonadota bacterium]
MTKLCVSGLLLCLTACTGTSVADPAEPLVTEVAGETIAEQRPNVLIVFADDWGFYSEAYADIVESAPWNQFAPTPHFSALAEHGVLFANAFVSSPQCTPSRSALLSGQSFYRTGLAAIQDGIWDYTNPAFPMMLRESGYHAGYSSKVWSPGTPRDAPFGGPEFEYEDFGTDYDEFSQYVYAQMALGTSAEDAKLALYAQVRQNFDDFLSERSEDEPFLYWFGGRNPHREWIKGSGKELWGIDPDALEGNMPPFLPDVHEVREDLADYFGEIYAFDAMLGILLERLEETGEADNTIIIVSGDHGAPGFSHGKANLYDFGTRAPLVIHWPDQVEGGRMVTDFVDLKDIAPTLLDAAGIQIPDIMDATSLMPILLSDAGGRVDPDRNWVITGRERHVSTAREGNLPYPQRSYRTDDYLYIINFKPDRWPGGSPYNITETEAPDQDTLEHDTFITHNDMDGGPTKAFLILNRNKDAYDEYYDLAFAKRPEFELYDLRTDPNSLINLAGQAAYQEIQAELHDALMSHLISGGDPRVQGDGSRFDRMPYTFTRWRSE